MVNTSCLIQTKMKNDKTETKGKKLLEYRSTQC